jgi:hypothetical protein
LGVADVYLIRCYSNEAYLVSVFEVVGPCALARICSGLLVQTNGCARGFQPLMKALMAVVGSWTLRKVPRWMAWRSMMPNQTSPRFLHDADVGVKCTLMRGFSASQSRTGCFLWAPVFVEFEVAVPHLRPA